MRTWSRKSSLGGVKFKSEMDGHEAAVLRSLVESVAGLLDERASSAPQDELAALTGLRTGNSETPDNPVLARLLPDFQRTDPDKVAPDSDDLGIDADTPESLEPDDPRAPHLDVYHWLTWMQDSLVQALMP